MVTVQDKASAWYEKKEGIKGHKISYLKQQKGAAQERIKEDAVNHESEEFRIDDKYKRDIANLNLQITSLTQQLETGKYMTLAKERDQLKKDIAHLQVEIVEKKKQGMIEINDRERQKIQAIQKLSEEMDYKVKETQANLMALNEEQLQTTTRLTILQNHQLTTELDYQSK